MNVTSTPNELGTEHLEAMTPEQAQASVLEEEHWATLIRLCSRRLAGHPCLADEALNFVLEKLEEQGWKRVRTWQGLGSFKSFLTHLASNLLIDFQRAKLGHVRPPVMVRERARRQPLWMDAYELLAKTRLTRHEAVQCLLTKYPREARSAIVHVVSQIRGVLARQCRPTLSEISIDDLNELVCAAKTAEDEAQRGELKNLERFLACYILSSGERELPPDEQSERLRARLTITDEDLHFLRLKFVDNLPVTAIAKRLCLKGDPHKRYHKLLRSIRTAYQDVSAIPTVCVASEIRAPSHCTAER